MSTPPTNHAPKAAASSDADAPSRLGALRARLGRNRKLVLLGVGGVSFIVVSLTTLYYFLALHEAAVRPPPKLGTALALLDSGEYIPARQAAEKIQAAGQLQPGEWGAPPYIMGAASLHEADETIDPRDRAQRYLVASRYLERAQQRGFPKGRETEGLLLLGRSLHKAGRYGQAIAVLTELHEKSTALRPTTERLLASSYLRSDPPALDAALHHAEAALAAPHFTPSDREAALLLYGETLLARRDFARCTEQLAQIPRTSPHYPQAMLLQGRSLLEVAAATPSPALYTQAIDALRHAHSRRAAHHQASREAAYLIGVALRRSGNAAAARSQFLRVRKTYYESPEGIAASLEEAELAAELGEAPAALAAYQRTLQQVQAAPSLVNPWLTERQLAKRLESGCQQLLADHHYAQAVELAGAIAPPLAAEKSIELTAAAHEQWGEYLQHAAGNLATDRALAQQAAARQQFRAAGDAFSSLAKLRTTSRSYGDALWQAGRNYAAGRDLDRAVALYRQYLDEEAKRERPAVLVKLGEALLSLDRADEALAAFDECIRRFPKDPAAYDARLLASRALLEKNDPAQAKTMLQTNLHHESLTPRSDVWRDSLFALGTLLHDQGQALLIEQQRVAKQAAAPQSATKAESAHSVLHEALRYLVEAVERYPTDLQATLARFQIAEAHRHLARLPLARLQTESIESRRAVLNAEAQRELQAALAAYNELTAQLNRRADEASLAPIELAILRNAFFARGGVYYDLGQFDEAIEAYSTATNRYQHEPAAVEAYVQIASCYRRLNKPLEARGTLEQAKLVMARLPADADFTGTTRFGRDEWNTLLDWLSGT